MWTLLRYRRFKLITKKVCRIRLWVTSNRNMSKDWLKWAKSYLIKIRESKFWNLRLCSWLSLKVSSFYPTVVLKIVVRLVRPLLISACLLPKKLSLSKTKRMSAISKPSSKIHFTNLSKWDCKILSVAYNLSRLKMVSRVWKIKLF